ncbi:hypothetical protein MTP99_018842 [Tenebrio molitor]|nr:hypothetical protein MTP99_018842 [Tenebrio molitor]
MNKELSDEWAKNIGKKVIIEMSVRERNFQANVCWRHFEPKMFVHIVGGRLKKYAVPTLLYKPGPDEPIATKLPMFDESDPSIFSSIADEKEVDKTGKNTNQVSTDLTIEDNDLFGDHAYCLKSIPHDHCGRRQRVTAEVSVQTPEEFLMEKTKLLTKPRVPEPVTEQEFFMFVEHYFQEDFAKFVKSEYDLNK